MLWDDKEFEINRPHNAGRLYNFLINYKFQKTVGVLPFSLKHLSVLDICCGSGMISEYYARKGAKVSGTDLSIMYYPHQPGRFFRIFDNRILFYIAQKLFQVLNILFGKFGNKIQAIGLK